MVSKLLRSEEYMTFRSTIPLKNICVDNSKGEVIVFQYIHIACTYQFIVITGALCSQSWKVFDFGPKTIRCPLILLPPACGTADIYFKQLLELGKQGYRVLAVSISNLFLYRWLVRFGLEVELYY